MFPVPVPTNLCTKSKNARCCLIAVASEKCDEKKINQEMSETSVARIPRGWFYANLNDHEKENKNTITLFRSISEGLSTKEKNELGREMKRWALFDESKKPVLVYELPDVFGRSSTFHFLTPEESQSVTDMANPSQSIGITPNQKYKLSSFLTEITTGKKKAGGNQFNKMRFYFSTGTRKNTRKIPLSRDELVTRVQLTTEHANIIVLAPGVRFPSKSARKKNPDAQVLSWIEFVTRFFD